MPDVKLLETFPTPVDEPIVIEHVSEEFTSVCPKTGHPDFGDIVLRYQPAAPARGASRGIKTRTRTTKANGAPGGCVELKSLKLYYQSFRNEGIYYEAVTNTIRDHLAALTKPAWLLIRTDWRGRGGIRSRIFAAHGDVPAQWMH